jgi:hypothetical protein
MNHGIIEMAAAVIHRIYASPGNTPVGVVISRLHFPKFNS